MSRNLLISDAAKEVSVESHVLRYWEEELRLPIKRNELGHRYYTEEDVERFKQIKGMKERGLQLKAIKMILKDGRLGIYDMETVSLAKKDFSDSEEDKLTREDNETMAIQIVSNPVDISGEDKTYRLQLLLRQLILEAVKENNQELCREIKESVVKELDYQFRVQEEREEERERKQAERNEEYYQKMDELLRRKTLRLGGKKKNGEQKEKKTKEEKSKITSISEKKKRHFLF